jgi:hypothetical protein
MAFDTSPRVAAARIRLYRQAGPNERARIAADLSDALRELAIAGIKSRHPEYGEDEVLAEALALFYGRK